MLHRFFLKDDRGKVGWVPKAILEPFKPEVESESSLPTESFERQPEWQGTWAKKQRQLSERIA